ncbi:MAG: hypothetical protein ACLQLC_02275 [Candidatus Sulfotelmatobacter sp.]
MLTKKVDWLGYFAGNSALGHGRPSEPQLEHPPMAGRSAEEIREELNRLLSEQIDSLKRQTFGGIEPAEMLEQEERLKRIREVSADYIAALRRMKP